ncbi:MerR family transcriptional regulator [Rubellimicrobium rubrum]|uniref:MerR family transcriptional regulator n=1 Tax=Rubellimicrobium rubrum TaxID=2585369 RepID=A0A5C4MQA2_9RHOB|nr:MerR family transcriptional regulator [Rubellimicrobium rubrum]TNC46492.1 MerR family transcriptional regulator [Rubellimicrobium rubrum]
MTLTRRNLSPSQAARHLGVTVKALRLYESRGLIVPGRNAAGWRVYSPADMTRAAEVVALRQLGLSLAQIERAVAGEKGDLDAGLAFHEGLLCDQARRTAEALERVRSLRADLHRGQRPTAADLRLALRGEDEDALGDAPLSVGFELPWPWGGEWFELRNLGRLTFVTGPLGSGKTRLCERLAESLPDAGFLPLGRLADPTISERIQGRLAADPALAGRVERTLAWLVGDGAERSDALVALVVALEEDAPSVLVVDMVEEGLGEGTQEALIAHLRLRSLAKRALLLMTRSTSILDLDAVGANEAIIFCPASHAPPFRVVPHPRSEGYEAVATCLAAPTVRARTAGVVAAEPRSGPR